MKRAHLHMFTSDIDMTCHNFITYHQHHAYRLSKVISDCFHVLVYELERRHAVIDDLENKGKNRVNDHHSQALHCSGKQPVVSKST